VVTLHAQRETARYLVEDKGAVYTFTAVKDFTVVVSAPRGR
jgi:hypothetical protein